MRVVCDTNILIDLSKIRKLDLLRELFKKVIIPIEVKKELFISQKNRIEDDISKAIDEWIKVERVKDLYVLENLKIHIDEGEAACVVLYTETKADILAVNDLKARGIAHALGIKVIGTLGILRLAKDKGLIQEIKPLLDELIKIGAYIGKGLYKRILEDVGEV